MSDVVIVMQFLANPNKYGLNGTEPKHITADGIANSDCDQSTKGITLSDALAIQKLLLKIISLLPIKG